MALDLVDSGIEAVADELQRIVVTDVDLLQEASLHIVASGGKRLRPRLVFLAYLAGGGQDIAEAVPLAAAVELVHTATLVHDDINDHSPTRRGKVAVHARWGRTFALLTGDYLFTKVYELMAPYGAHLNSVMADACVSLVEGETLQAAAAKAGVIDRQTYKLIISRKTASLFEAASHMGALLAGSDGETADALSTYGYNLGMAFQIVDDVLDITGDPDTLGKPVGNDLAHGAGVIMAQNGTESVSEIMVAQVEADPIQSMMARLRDSGAVEIALAQAHEMASRAHAALSGVPESPAKTALAELVDLVVHRER